MSVNMHLEFNNQLNVQVWLWSEWILRASVCSLSSGDKWQENGSHLMKTFHSWSKGLRLFLNRPNTWAQNINRWDCVYTYTQYTLDRIEQHVSTLTTVPQLSAFTFLCIFRPLWVTLTFSWWKNMFLSWWRITTHAKTGRMRRLPLRLQISGRNWKRFSKKWYNPHNATLNSSAIF